MSCDFPKRKRRGKGTRFSFAPSHDLLKHVNIPWAGLSHPFAAKVEKFAGRNEKSKSKFVEFVSIYHSEKFWRISSFRLASIFPNCAPIKRTRSLIVFFVPHLRICGFPQTDKKTRLFLFNCDIIPTVAFPPFGPWQIKNGWCGFSAGSLRVLFWRQPLGPWMVRVVFHV